MTRTDAHGRTVEADDTVLGKYDSTVSRDPQRSTFSDAARIAADLILGVQDSSQRSGTTLIGTQSVPTMAMPSDVIPPRRVGPATGREGWNDYTGEHRRVIESAQARDSASDSQGIERVVATLMEQRIGVSAEHSRRLRDGPVAGRVGAGGSRRDAASVPHDEVRIGGSDATRLVQERQERIERHARPVDATNARSWNSTSTIPVVPVARASVDVTLPPVESQPQRRWRDGGAVSARQEPLGAGPARPEGTVGRHGNTNNRSETPSMYLSPESLRA